LVLKAYYASKFIKVSCKYSKKALNSVFAPSKADILRFSG